MALRLLYLTLLLCTPSALYAQTITSYLEMIKVSNVGGSWKNVSLENSYSNPVIVCTYNLPSKNDNEATVRVKQQGTSFQIKVQRPLNSSDVTASDVYCTVSETGAYTYPIKYEANTIISSQNTINSNWASSLMENITTTKSLIYDTPVVIGQVMSDNNDTFSVFWSNNCSGRGSPPTNTAMCVGKHTGGSGVTLTDSETLGYIIAEEAEYSMANAYVKIAVGADSVAGTRNTPPYTYSLPRSYQYATATQAAEDGGNGGWAVFYGSPPVGSSLNLAIEEEITGADSSRTHTKEQVSYWAMQPIYTQYADIIINEILYIQSTDQNEFVEFYVTSSGSLLNYTVSSQDGISQDYQFPDVNVNTGDYVVLYSGTGTNQISTSPYIFYTGGSTSILANTSDDVVLLKPSATDATFLPSSTGPVMVNGIPIDYVSYGSGGSIDPPPISEEGVSVTWDTSDNLRLASTASGQSISLTLDGTDTNTSVCWERTRSGEASACSSFIITSDTDGTAYINSQGKNNTEAPNIKLQKSVITIYDPYNGASNPKAIPGSVLEYIITANNSGVLAADNNSITLKDLVPANTKLCTADIAYCKAPYLIDGSPSSGLTLGSVKYYSGSTLVSATADADGVDSNITGLEAPLLGAFSAQTGTNPPEFTFRFRVMVN